MKKIALISALLLTGCSDDTSCNVDCVALLYTAFGHSCAQLHLTEEQCVEWAKTSVEPSESALDDAFMNDLEGWEEDDQ